MQVREEVKELRKLWGGFWPSRVLITANNLEIFDQLKQERTAAEVSRSLKTDLRATEIILDALTGLGLLTKTHDRYINTDTAKNFLTKDSPYYQGDILRHADVLWQNWSALDECVKTGKPARKAQNQGSFIRGMHNLAVLKAADIIDAVGMEGVKTALDLGGGPGTYAVEMAKRGIKVTLFDTPETITIAKGMIQGPEKKQIRFMSGDFLAHDIGSDYDLVFLSQILHAFSSDGCQQILKNAFDALRTNGRIVIQEFPVDESRTLPLQGALFAVNMLVNTEGGRCYAPSEMKAWLEHTGFTDVEDRMFEETVLVFGTKREAATQKSVWVMHR